MGEILDWIVMELGTVLPSLADLWPALAVAAVALALGLRFSRSPGRVAAAVLALVVLVGVLDALLFGTTLRLLLARASARQQVLVSTTEATGSHLTGRASCRGVRYSKRTTEGSQLELTAREADVDVDLWSLAGPELVVTSTRLAGVSGRIAKRAGQPAPPRRGRNFVLERLEVTDARFVIERISSGRSAATTFEIVVDRLSCGPVRREFSVFDVSFRSDLRGTLAGAPMRIEPDVQAGRRVTHWSVDGVPLAILFGPDSAGRGWFEDGRVELKARHDWDDSSVSSDWSLTIKDLRVRAPATTGLVGRLLAGPAKLANRLGRSLGPFSFRTSVPVEKFRNLTSLQASALVAEVKEEIRKKLGSALGRHQEP